MWVNINDPSPEHYTDWGSGPLIPAVHWTLLVEIVCYEHQNIVGRPQIRCKDADGQEFNVTGYFDEFGRRKMWFDARIAPTINLVACSLFATPSPKCSWT